MTGFFIAKPYLVALLAGFAAQAVKVVSFLVVEKKVNYKRFVQTDGSPNMHSATMSALALSVGFREGFDSIVFSLSLCLTIVVMVDTWNVKQAHSKQQEVMLLMIDKWGSRHAAWAAGRKALSYTPLDVLTGAALGAVVSLLLL
ncbi:MAG: divergent PAP2 family protein [Candidatus Latescibacterota bacterium]|jgi:acid phosphatase family membrane protein YuiD